MLGRLAIWEAVDKPFIFAAVLREDRRLGSLARLGESTQVPRRLGNGGVDCAAPLFPALAVERVEFDGLMIMRQQRRRVFWYGRCGGDPERGALDFLKGGLRQRIITAQRADAAIFQFDPHRTLRIDGIDIEHGARIPDLARLVDPLVRAIADGDQLFA